MNEFYLEMRTFSAKNQAMKEMQDFVSKNYSEVMDDTCLRKFKVKLLRRHLELLEKYPRCNPIPMIFEKSAALFSRWQTIHLSRCFEIAILQLGDGIELKDLKPEQ